MIEIIPLHYMTDEYNQYLIITKDVEEAIQKSKIKNGMVTVETKHTTTGISVNEALECLESDIDVFLGKLVPEDAPYSHCHILRDYGSTGGNPTGHIKAMLTGNHCHFPLIDGKLVKGSAQDIWFCEYDGPSQRTVNVIIQGD
ncbi:MAG: secondary thiamine-phosphate synthase enzyme YjbQ [Erysipelotrichaceae bacterium]|nr:YjbQ family protein [Erysipelotrichaceae bacterium]MBQ1691819.1 YjbQ family protein [Erysipelotrichaceae bacterium]MBQ1740891.1 YjbQ family protein [Erysipelotrichaceae bacterium]MBQ1811464.1 YjbQ family protein [Erysipelotrichaceae bacterium]MBQ1910494.1 YjbQ family protein [Erysipelotrichaceae bacterium]